MMSDTEYNIREENGEKILYVTMDFGTDKFIDKYKIVDGKLYLQTSKDGWMHSNLDGWIQIKHLENLYHHLTILGLGNGNAHRAAEDSTKHETRRDQHDHHTD